MRGTRWLLVAAVVGCGGSKDDSGTPTPTDSVETPSDLLVEEGGVVVCETPSDREVFGPFDRKASSTPPNSDLWIWAGGEIGGDFDGDGWLDVGTPNELGLELYLGSEDGVFQPVGLERMGQFDLSFGTGGSVADYDGDGDLDIYVNRYVGEPGPETPGLGANVLLQNQGDGQFVDVTAAAGVDGCGVHHRTGEQGCYRTMSSSWADFDHDGDLDLFVGNYGFVDETGETETEDFLPAEPSFLYENNGDGTFTSRDDQLSDAVHDGYTYVGGFRDLNNDGWPEIYVVNDFGSAFPNVVLWNREGTFEQGDGSEGLSFAMTGMGLSYGDLNNDGWPDLVVPEWNKFSLLESRPELIADGLGADGEGKGLWVDFGKVEAMGLVPDTSRGQKVAWGSEFGDMDNDGDLDIVSPYGHVANENPRWSNPLTQPDALYINEPDGAGGYSFVDKAPEWGVNDPSVGRGALVADLNRDGWLDIAKRDLAGPNVAYLSRCGEEGWLVVHLREPEGLNTHAVGAKVVLEVGEERYQRVIVAGGTGYGAGVPPEAHFGLGMVDAIDAIEITWPDGRVDRVSGVASRQQITITR